MIFHFLKGYELGEQDKIQKNYKGLFGTILLTEKACFSISNVFFCTGMTKRGSSGSGGEPIWGHNFLLGIYMLFLLCYCTG